MKREIEKPFKRTIRVLSNCWVRCDFLCFTTRLLAWSSQPPVTKVSDGFNCPCTWGIHRTFEILWPTYSATVSPTFAIAKDFLCTWRANYRLRSSSPLSSYIQTRLNYMKKILLKLYLGTARHRRLRRVFKMASFEKAKKSYQRFHKERGQVREEKTILCDKLVFNRRQYNMEREFDKQSSIKTKSIRKLSNFNFQWTNKTLYPNNLNNIAFFFTLFNGNRYL